jgi:O-acetyl-ADP-ribose deacetylase (regulator of RNase III)
MEVYAPSISLTLGDITTFRVDAIVNAANPALAGGGGVDGAIHRAAGPELLEACMPFAPLATGKACITPGFQLKASYVIHTVGPVWEGGHGDEPQLLADCYHNSMVLAEKHKLQTIVFPAISTGAYKFPLERATKIALETLAEYLDNTERKMEVVLVFHNAHDYKIAQRIEKQVFS